MALMINLSKTVDGYDGELVANNVYCKVVEFRGSKNRIYFTVSLTRDSNFISKCNFDFIPTMDNNFIKQAYEYLKTLDEYSDAVDC